MIDKMKKIVMDEKYCVLATAMDNKPYCSLMAYAVEDDCSKIYMVTIITKGNITKIAFSFNNQ